MQTPKITTLVAVLLALTVPAVGQAVYVLRLPGTNVTEGFYLPSAEYTAGSSAATNPRVPVLGLPHFFGGAAAPTVFPGQGGHAIDQQTGRMISSDGFQIWEEPHPRYPVPFTANPPIPAPVLTPPSTGAVNPIMGLGADPSRGAVWMVDYYGFQPFASAYPHGALGGLVIPTFAHSQFTGIAYEPSTGTLWLCDIQGCVYNCDILGNPIGAQPVACVPATLKGIAVNTTNGPGSVPAPACSAQVGGFHIIVTDGVALYDALSGANRALTPGVTGAYGLAYSSDVQYSFGGSPWVGSGMVPRTRINGPAINTGTRWLRLEGAMPSTTAFFLYDLCPLATPVPCGLGALRVFGGFITLPTDTAGVANLALPLAGVPAGAQFSFQWAFADSAQPCGVVFTDAATLTIGLP